MGTYVECVCNLPGPLDSVVALVKETGPITSSVLPRLFAVVGSEGWVQVNDNWVGPAFGSHAEGDVGV